MSEDTPTYPGQDELNTQMFGAPQPAAPTAQEAVQALDWVDLGDSKSFRALLPIIGSVRVEPYGCCGWWEVLWSMPGQCDKLIPDVFDNPDDAKAAAQADYERRILAVLTPAPQPAASVDREALVDAIDTARNAWLEDRSDRDPEADKDCQRYAKITTRPASEIAAEADEVARLKAENTKVRAALTPSAETKVAYMGEFSVPFPHVDEDGNEVISHVNVPWTTIKQIMAAICARAALADGGTNG